MDEVPDERWPYVRELAGLYLLEREERAADAGGGPDFDDVMTRGSR